MEDSEDNAYIFDVTLAVHEDDEAEANKAMAKLLDEAEKIGVRVVWKEPAYF